MGRSCVCPPDVNTSSGPRSSRRLFVLHRYILVLACFWSFTLVQYLKLMGGYDFPGSWVVRIYYARMVQLKMITYPRNSSTDIWWVQVNSNRSDQSWMPLQHVDRVDTRPHWAQKVVRHLMDVCVHSQSNPWQFKLSKRTDMVEDLAWFYRRYTNFLISILLPYFDVKGLCVLTAGTDDRPTIEWQNVKLLKAHNYAIIGNACTTYAVQYLTILNLQARRRVAMEIDGSISSILEYQAERIRVKICHLNRNRLKMVNVVRMSTVRDQLWIDLP